MTLLDLAAWAPTVRTVLAALFLLAVAVLLGIALGRKLVDRALDEAAVRSLEELRRRQTRDDRQALRHLPPTVTLSDAIEHAARLGIGVAEAADDLYVRRARALIERNLRRHRHPQETDR